EEILTKTKCDKTLFDAIIECIKTHSFDGEYKPETLEAKVLFDADKIDSYGFIGVARFFLLAGEEHLSFNKAVENAFERIITLGKVGGFFTNTGKKIGLKKAKRSILFYYLLLSELGDTKKLQEIENTIKEKLGEQTLSELKAVADKL
ncbi:MAG: hypothetical protein NUV57_06085, partial [archaeon]|nr:hypothetical protein [archaeon]